jgi:hypothetical protein
LKGSNLVFEVQHKCNPGDSNLTDFVAINRPEEQLIILMCPKCNEQFWVKPQDARYFADSRAHSTVTGVDKPALILPGHRN